MDLISEQDAVAMAAAPSVVRLAERQGVFRRLYGFECDQVRQHLLRLSTEDRRSRFGSAVSDSDIETYGERMDWRRENVIGYWVGRTLRAIGELKPLGRAGFVDAEIALSVEEGWRRDDVERELLKRLAIVARNRLAGSLYMICLPRNAELRHLVCELDADRSVGDVEAEARFALGSPDQLTLMLERRAETGDRRSQRRPDWSVGELALSA